MRGPTKALMIALLSSSPIVALAQVGGAGQPGTFQTQGAASVAPAGPAPQTGLRPATPQGSAAQAVTGQFQSEAAAKQGCGSDTVVCGQYQRLQGMARQRRQVLWPHEAGRLHVPTDGAAGWLSSIWAAGSCQPAGALMEAPLVKPGTIGRIEEVLATAAE